MSDTGDFQNRVSRRAHELWEREGHPHGRHDEHWAQAEAQIRAEDGARAAKTDDPAGGGRKTAGKGTRAAAEGLSTVESDDKPAAAKADAAKTRAKAGPAKPAATKTARTPRKDGGKSASTH